MAKAIVMARSDGDVFHASGFGEGDPGFRINFSGSKNSASVRSRGFEFAVMKHPLAVAEHAVNAPVDEHAKLCVLKFLTGFRFSVLGV